MSDDTTKSLIEARLDQIIKLAQEMNDRIQGLESEQKTTTAQLASLETKVDHLAADLRGMQEYAKKLESRPS